MTTPITKIRKGIPFSKYKVYLSEADTYAEAVEMAPDDVDVQEGTNGGFYYEKDPGGGSGGDDGSDAGGAGSADEGISTEDLDFDGFDVSTFDAAMSGDEEQIGVDMVDQGVTQGDLLYVQHPDGNYIAEVDDIDTGYNDWAVSFGGGQYQLRPDTTSTPVGLVEDVAELGDNEIIVNRTANPGDIVAWKDPADYTHFSYASDVPSDADVQGVVEHEGPPEPDDKYDLADESWISENTRIQNTEQAAEFNQDLAEATLEGDATELPAYRFMSHAGAIKDKDLAIDAYESLMANDPNKTQRERMERRLRGMGIDPENIKDSDIDPNEVPSVRQGTVWSGFESQRAINVAAVAAHEDTFLNWETWNDFFDHMTEKELEAALRTAVTEEPDLATVGGDPLNYANVDIEFTDNTPSDVGDSVGAIMSRLPEGSADVVEDIAQGAEPDVENELYNFGASYLKSPEDRRYFYEQYHVDHRWAKVQFDDSFSPEHRVQRMGDIHTETTGQQDAYAMRAQMWGVAGADDERVNGYNNRRPIGPVEPSENVKEALEWQESTVENALESGEDPNGFPLTSNIQDKINPDGTITLRRGVKDKVTGHSPVESWTVRDSTAQQFDGEGIMEVRARPEEILTAHDINHSNFATEQEFTLLGGKIAGRAKVVEGEPFDPDAPDDIEAMLKKFDPEEHDFMIAPNREWVEAAIYDDMFDAGMFTEARLVDGKEVPIERFEEMMEEREEVAEKMAQGAADRLSGALEKDGGGEWVYDPTEQAPNRWMNTNTGEYRYQENKPGGGGGVEEPETSDSVEDEIVSDVEINGLDKLNEEHQGVVHDRLEAYNQSHNMEHLDKIEITEDMPRQQDVPGLFDPVDGELRLHPKAFDRESEKWDDWYEPSVNDSEDGAYWTLDHELGHAANLGEIGKEEWNRIRTPGQKLDDEELHAIYDDLGQVAAFGPLETVAEAFAALQRDVELSEKTMDVYKRYGGPGVEQ